MGEETDYPDAKEYYPNGIKCRYCGKLCYGIRWGNSPYDICNDCAVPIEFSVGEHGEGYVREPDGAVSLA